MTRNINTLGLGMARQPKTVIFGPGQRRQISNIVAGIATHVLITTDERMAATDTFSEIVTALKSEGLTVSTFDGALPDLPRKNILEVVERYSLDPSGDGNIDAVLGIGGGSCLDLAKVVSVVLSNGGNVRDYYGEFNVPGPGLPVVAVPTTGGTGSEVTSIAVIFDDILNAKVGVASPHLEPVAAIIDPELTLTCPPGLTAATAADALSHLIEAFTARAKNPSPEDIATKLYVGKNLITDIFARKGLELLNKSLQRVVDDPSDIEARGDVMFAAYCSGMAINTTGTAAAHAIQSAISAVSHASHGFGVGALLPYVMRFNLPNRVAEFAEIGRLLNVAEVDQPELEQAHRGIERVEELLQIVGAPLNLSEIGVTLDHIEKIAEQSMLATRLIANNPRELDKQATMAILEKGCQDDRSWWTLA
ncbi:MAG: iron-containing alcohol dehydrogenase [Woeseiaceae bacterium]|nr:iron-containing alcohol dehydrogenase [Woeseiaceae bacterium]